MAGTAQVLEQQTAAAEIQLIAADFEDWFAQQPDVAITEQLMLETMGDAASDQAVRLTAGRGVPTAELVASGEQVPEGGIGLQIDVPLSAEDMTRLHYFQQYLVERGLGVLLGNSVNAPTEL